MTFLQYNHYKINVQEYIFSPEVDSCHLVGDHRIPWVGMLHQSVQWVAGTTVDLEVVQDCMQDYRLGDQGIAGYRREVPDNLSFPLVGLDTAGHLSEDQDTENFRLHLLLHLVPHSHHQVVHLSEPTEYMLIHQFQLPHCLPNR